MPAGCRLGSPLQPRAGGLSAGQGIPAQGVAAGAPHRRRVRRPQPGLLLPARGGVRVVTRTDTNLPIFRELRAVLRLLGGTGSAEAVDDRVGDPLGRVLLDEVP